MAHLKTKYNPGLLRGWPAARRAIRLPCSPTDNVFKNTIQRLRWANRHDLTTKDMPYTQGDVIHSGTCHTLKDMSSSKGHVIQEDYKYHFPLVLLVKGGCAAVWWWCQPLVCDLIALLGFFFVFCPLISQLMRTLQRFNVLAYVPYESVTAKSFCPTPMNRLLLQHSAKRLILTSKRIWQINDGEHERGLMRRWAEGLRF